MNEYPALHSIFESGPSGISLDDSGHKKWYEETLSVLSSRGWEYDNYRVYINADCDSPTNLQAVVRRVSYDQTQWRFYNESTLNFFLDLEFSYVQLNEGQIIQLNSALVSLQKQVSPQGFQMSPSDDSELNSIRSIGLYEGVICREFDSAAETESEAAIADSVQISRDGISFSTSTGSEELSSLNSALQGLDLLLSHFSETNPQIGVDLTEVYEVSPLRYLGVCKEEAAAKSGRNFG